MFLIPKHQMVTVDDDVMGTRSCDNPVNIVSSRKAGKEGNCAEVVADVILQLVLSIRFRRRGKGKFLAVKKVLASLIEGRGEISCLLTVDRGYGKPEFANIIRDFRVSAL